MEEIKREGLCREIGLSNFHAKHIDQIKGKWAATPSINQVNHEHIAAPFSLGVVPGGCELGAKVMIQDRYVDRVALQYYASTTDNWTSMTEEYSFARELPVEIARHIYM